MSFQLNRSSKAPMSEINVTPFVDVMLVLLIIFMVTAPLLTVGVQVDLPESSADSLPDDQEPLTLSINSFEKFSASSLVLNRGETIAFFLREFLRIFKFFRLELEAKFIAFSI